MILILRKICSIVFALWVIVTLNFGFLYLLPGNAARMILGPQASGEAVAAFRHAAGLDQPLTIQYARYVTRLAHLNLGESFSLRQPVVELLRERGSATLTLTLGASTFVLICGLGLPLGLKLLYRERLLKLCERVLTVAALAPPYVLAIIALLLGAGWLGWIPVVFNPQSIGSWVLPSLVLGAYPAALVLRLFSVRFNEELATAYVRRARALGLSRARILYCEALPNALPAALAALTNSLAYFVTGAFFVEVVFGIPGWGRLAQEALRNKDVAVLSGLCLSFAVIVLLLSTMLDTIQVKLDPRARKVNENV